MKRSYLFISAILLLALAVGANQVSNPSFENWLDSWTNSGGWYIDEYYAHDGINSAYVYTGCDQDYVEVYVNHTLIKTIYPTYAPTWQYDEVQLENYTGEDNISIKFMIMNEYIDQRVNLTNCSNSTFLTFWTSYCNVQCNVYVDDVTIMCNASIEYNCSNYMDDDEDGLTDCEDPDCDGMVGEEGSGALCEYWTELSCYDSFDNDADFMTDYDDPDCGGQLVVGGNWCTQWDEFECDETFECFWNILSEMCEYDNSTYCAQYTYDYDCNNDYDCWWDYTDAWCRTIFHDMTYCTQFNETECLIEPSCYFNMTECIYNDTTYCAAYNTDVGCRNDPECYWDQFDMLCYMNTYDVTFYDCFKYDGNESGCRSQESCNWDPSVEKCFFAPKCYLYGGNDVECADHGCKYLYEENKCVVDIGDSECYRFFNETSCLESAFCDWDYFSNECYEDFGDQCSFYDGTMNLCEQQPACIWIADKGICEQDYLSGYGSYCWDYETDRAGCELVGGCVWYSDPLLNGFGWCDPMGIHENCTNGKDDNNNGLCDINGCYADELTFLPPDPDCRLIVDFELDFDIISPTPGLNLNPDILQGVSEDKDRIKAARYVLNKLGEPYCDIWIDHTCGFPINIVTGRANMTQDYGPLLGKYELSVFVMDKKGDIFDKYVYFIAGDEEFLKPRIQMLYPADNESVSYDDFLEFEIDPRGKLVSADYVVDRIGGAELPALAEVVFTPLPGDYYHRLQIDKRDFPLEGEYRILVRAQNGITSNQKVFYFKINDTNETIINRTQDFADRFAIFLEEKRNAFQNSSNFRQDEQDLILLLKMVEEMGLKLDLLKQYQALLATETNITRIIEIKGLIQLLKQELPGEIDTLGNLNTSIQNVRGSFIDSIIRYIQNQTGEDLDLLLTQEQLNKLKEIRKEPTKLQIKYLDGHVENITKICEKLISNETNTTLIEVCYTLKDSQIDPNIDFTSLTKTIYKLDGEIILVIDKNMTGLNDLELCIGDDACNGTANLNSSVINFGNSTNLFVLKSDPIVKWNFNSQASNPSANNNNNGGGGGGGGSRKNVVSQPVVKPNPISVPSTEPKEEVVEEIKEQPAEAEEPLSSVLEGSGMQDITGAVVGAGPDKMMLAGIVLIIIVAGLFVYFHFFKGKF